MNFTDIEFYSNGFSLTREDNQQIVFPYSKLDYIIQDPATGKLRIEVKKHGAFIRLYENETQRKKDANLLIGKGRC